MHDCLWLKRAKCARYRLIIGGVIDAQLHTPARNLFPCRYSFLEGVERDQAGKISFEVEMPALKIINDQNFMPFGRKVERLRPAKIAVSACNKNTHRSS